MSSLSNILADLLEHIADKLRDGTSEISKDQMLDAMDILSAGDKSTVVGKEEACKYMRMSRATFDTYVRLGFIPKGDKHLGLKELTWSKLDLDIAKEKIRQR